MINDDMVVYFANVISEYCSSRPCNYCPFFVQGEIKKRLCALQFTPPDVWEIDEIKSNLKRKF